MAGNTQKRSFFKRTKSCPFSGPDAMVIDWKDPRMLSRFVSESGKIVPSRISNVSQKKMRTLSKALKRARYMGLLSYTGRDDKR